MKRIRKDRDLFIAQSLREMKKQQGFLLKVVQMLKRKMIQMKLHYLPLSEKITKTC